MTILAIVLAVATIMSAWFVANGGATGGKSDRNREKLYRAAGGVLIVGLTASFLLPASQWLEWPLLVGVAMFSGLSLIAVCLPAEQHGGA